MSEKDIMKFLRTLGLSEKEMQVYIFLSKNGVQSTSYVANKLKIERVQAYRTFRKLQEKGFIEATLERPTRFAIIPFEKLVDSFIVSKKKEVAQLIERKKKLISTWHTLSKPEIEYPVTKFALISGKKKIFTKMQDMIKESTKKILIVTTSLGLIKEEVAGIFDTIIIPALKYHTKVQIITDISEDNLATLERIEKTFRSKKLDVKIRHLTTGSKFFPRFLIKDEEEAILHTQTKKENSFLKLEDEGLWINDRMFISILIAFFGTMWHSGVEASRRIDELKTGIPIGEIAVIKNPEEAWDKVIKVLETAGTDILFMTSSQSINQLEMNDPFMKYRKKGLKFRIMAPIDLDNLEAAQRLSVDYEVKHIPMSYVTMMIVDKKHLFMFKKPSSNEMPNESGLYLEDIFYSNDLSSTERLSEMLNDTWKRGLEISEISSQAGMKMPLVEVTTVKTLSKLAKTMIQKNVDAIVITENQKPIGLINNRNLLKEIIENQKNPEKTSVKDLDYTPLINLNNKELMTEALKVMHKKRMKRVAIVKNGKLVGMLAEEPAKKQSASVKTKA